MHGDFSIYRCQKRGSAPLLLKAVTRPDRYPNLTSLLVREFEYRDRLGETWAVQPIALTQFQASSALILSDPGGDVLSKFIDQQHSLSDRLKIAISIVNSVSRMHERGIVHQDLKPDNILIDLQQRRTWLGGFGGAHIASSTFPLVRKSDRHIEGTLAYLAPERAIWMRAEPDLRSDLYSIGIILYELFAHKLPFTAATATEWMHSHAAREPLPLHTIIDDFPETLSSIVSHLLEKSVEQRYQSAAACEADLRICISEAVLAEPAVPFSLARFDATSILLRRDVLVERDRELTLLRQAHDRVSAGRQTEMIFIEAGSGEGKTTLVEYFLGHLDTEKSISAIAKLDPLNGEAPLAAFLEVLKNILSVEFSLRMTRKSKAVLRELEHSAGLISSLAEHLDVETTMHQNRASISPVRRLAVAREIIQRLAQLFFEDGRVFTLFIDDLQWSDPDSIELLRDLLVRGPDVPLLLIATTLSKSSGEHGGNERGAISLLQAASTTVHITPLTFQGISYLISQLLYIDIKRAELLATTLGQRLITNPFSIVQSLVSLCDEGLLTYSPAVGWKWDDDQVSKKGFTDDVLTLIRESLNRLPVESLKALQQAACLGSHVTHDVLDATLVASSNSFKEALREAVIAGHIFPNSDGYRFAHDRIRELAYALINRAERDQLHLDFGRALHSASQRHGSGVNVYDAVTQLNLVESDALGPDDRRLIAEANLAVAKLSKETNNYPSALAYSENAASYLSANAWSIAYEIMLASQLIAAECELLTGLKKASAERLNSIAPRCKSIEDLGRVTRLHITSLTSLDRSKEAVEIGLRYLQAFDPMWSPDRDASVDAEYHDLQKRIGEQSIEMILDAPAMTDPSSIIAMDVLAEIMSPASFTDRKLHDLIPLRMVNLVLSQGITDAASFAFVHLAMVVGPRFGDYKTAYRFAKLGLDLVQHRGIYRFHAKTLLCFGNLVLPWTRAAREGRHFIRSAFEVAITSGDINFAAYSRNNLISNMLLVGDPLPEVELEIRAALAFIDKLPLQRVHLILTTQLALVTAMTGGSLGKLAFQEFDQEEIERILEEDPQLSVAEYCYWVRKLQVSVLAGDYEEARAFAGKAEALVWTSPYFLETAEYHLYAGLAYAMPLRRLEHPLDQDAYDKLLGHRSAIAILGGASPQNFLAISHLLNAETARVEGRHMEAIKEYEYAIASSRRFNLPHHEGISSECAAAFFEEQYAKTAAEGYRTNAALAFQRWGAQAKVRKMGQNRSVRVEVAPLSYAANTVKIHGESLDLEAVLRASQALSQEIILDTLVEKLLRLALEHAGANRAVLLMGGGERLDVIATSEVRGQEILFHPDNSNFAADDDFYQIVDRTFLTKQSTILDYPETGFSDRILRSATHSMKSVLCLPLSTRGDVVAALYLENTLSPNMFTSDRISILEMIGAQAAISIEHARLYQDLQKDIAHRMSVEEDLRRNRKILAVAQRVSGIGSWYWSIEDQHLEWSDEMFRLLGYDPGKTIASAENFWARLHPDDVAGCKRTVETGLRRRRGFKGTFRIVLANGSIRCIESLSVSMAGAPGKMDDFLGTLMDVTERRQAEEKMKSAEAELARAYRLTTMGELVASMAHEINQPLSAIVFNAAAALKWLDKAPEKIGEVRKALGHVTLQGKRAGDIIRSVRALATRSATNSAAFRLREAIDEVFALIGPETRKHSIEIQLEIDGRDELYGDRVQIQQVLLNLSMNAIESMIGKEKQRELSIKSRRLGDDRLVIEVCDTGHGFDEADANCMFDAFYTKKSSGMGMGLSICRTIVRAHGGELIAQMRDNGAMFSFSVPMKEKKA